MPATTVGSVLVSLGMESAEFERGISRAQTQMASAARSMQTSGRQIEVSSGGMKSGMQQLSFQLNDIATQWASGTRPMQIFAQQSGQVVQAIGLMSNGAGKFGAFMAGPWGMAITAGIVVLSALIPKLMETSEELEKVKFASNAVGDAQGILGNVMDLTTGKINTQNKALVALARAQILVARLQSQARAAEAKSAISAAAAPTFAKPDAMGALGGAAGLYLSRTRGVEGDVASQFLKGVQSVPTDLRAEERVKRIGGLADTAIKQLEKLQQKGAITAETFSGLVSSIANFGAETSNQNTFKEAEKLLDGEGGTGLLKPAKDKKTKEKKGKSASDIEAQFNAERIGLMQQMNSAYASNAMSAEAEAEYAMRNVELARIRTENGIKANKDYTAKQKDELLGAVQEIAEQERVKVDREKTKRLEQEAQEVAQQQFEAQRDALQAQISMADTDGERQRLALEIFDLEQQYKKDTLDRVIASGTRTDAEKALAAQAKNLLESGEGAQRAAVVRQTETRMQAYLRSTQMSKDQINEALDGIRIDGLEALNDGLVDAIMGVRSLGDVFRNVANQIIADLIRIQLRKAITGGLSKLLGGIGGFGGGGGMGGAEAMMGSGNISIPAMPDSFIDIPAFANGTSFAPGGMAWVGERGRELVQLPRGSQVIPNHELGGIGGGIAQIVPSPYFDVVVDGRVMQAAPAIAGAGGQLGYNKVVRAGSRRLGA